VAKKRQLPEKGYARYQAAISHGAAKHMKNFKNSKRLATAVHNHLFDLPGPKQVNRKKKPRDIFFGLILRGFTEISKSVEMLNDIRFYVGRFPFSDKQVPKERYLKFQIEAHLHEIYILRERLKSYVKIIQRQYKRSPRLREIQAACDVLSTFVDEALKGPVRARDGHVHSARFGDEALDRLDTIGLLKRNGDGEFGSLMSVYYKLEYSKIRRTGKPQ
jgi:hypothetical protein